MSIGASIDWLTVTNTDPKTSYGLLNLARAILQYSQDHGNAVDEWRWKQYKGYHAQGVSYGERDDSVILQLSGAIADEFAMAAYKQATNCTRIDLAVTVKYEPVAKGIADECYERGCQFTDRKGSGPGFTVVRNSRGGSTCYVGSRISDLYARVYDKWQETHDARYQGCWRWEMECKGEVARRVAPTFCLDPKRASPIAATVWRYFARRGVEPGWSVDDHSVQVVHSHPVPTANSRLKWLAEQVRPTITWLCERGLLLECVEALDLPLSLAEQERLRGLAESDGHNNT